MFWGGVVNYRESYKLQGVSLKMKLKYLDLSTEGL
jgi:hypothetical protein